MTRSPDSNVLKDDAHQTLASEGDLLAFPTSFAQQRLWLIGQLESGSAYNMYTALRFTGRINFVSPGTGAE